MENHRLLWTMFTKGIRELEAIEQRAKIDQKKQRTRKWFETHCAGCGRRLTPGCNPAGFRIHSCSRCRKQPLTQGE